MIASLLLLVAAAAPTLQSAEELQKLFKYKRDLVLVDCAERHYKLGAWCWNNDLLQQSTAEVIYALEISDQRHTRSRVALSKMRALDDEFWQKERKPPNRFTVKTYDKRQESARDKDLREHVELAVWAQRKGLTEEALGIYLRVLRANGDALEVDDKGRIALARKKVPEEISSTILAQAVEINGRTYLRDAFLEHMPQVETLHEAGSDELRVRGTVSAELVADLHALGAALYPVLERDLAGHPTQRMNLFVFARRSKYDAYLEAAGLQAYRGGSGVADRASYTAIACAEGRSDDDLRALCLHELTHLFHYGITRGVLPDWYEEGLAETYGGQGTFEWDGEELHTGGKMAPHRLTGLAAGRGRMPLEDLLSANAAQLFRTDRERALAFYAQSWAFLRFLRAAPDERISERFRKWELMASGAALGARAGEYRAHDAREASELFRELMGDLGALQSDFFEYLDELE